MPNDKPLEPPAPVYSPYKPQDRTIALVTNILPLGEENPYADCKTGGDRLERMLELAEEKGQLYVNALLIRL